MTERIYEYKDEQDWFIGKWDGFNYLTCFGDDQTYETVQDDFHRLVAGLQVEGLQVHVVKLQSMATFLRFLVETINQEQDRYLQLVQHKGGQLVMEQDRLLYVHLDKAGVLVADFFEQPEV
ncbi:hypothetical protein HCC70_07610 [Streptococcus suis]|uniref:Uncharacterized protein n=1 Tax=Streptococcus suivaginalis TaxID=3028082 RepID=A0AA96VDG7_9STRE|nr:hypothetical protein [Streptococcus sp. 29896]MCK4028197.1 hypothetical protein [Streptococcus suis]WNY46674.1 hypothetical protein PXH68_07195 [Streptococcus sp. 29896]